MSTKTTFKRVALVAVAALGMGVLSTTVANAATVYTTAITVSTNKAPVAGANGTVVTHTLRFSTSTSTAQTVEPNVILSSKPAGSALVEQTETTAVVSGKFEVSTSATVATDADGQGVDGTTASESGYTNYQFVTYLHAYYDVPGTYTYTIFDDQGTDDGIFNGTDFATTLSVVVGATGVTATYTGTASAINASSVVSGANGSLVKIGLTSAGAAANPDNAGGVRVTLSGPGVIAKVNNSGVTATTTYTLGQNDFNGSGFAWVNITSATAQTLTVTLSGVGSMASSFTAPSPVVLTYVAAVASASAPVIGMGAALATSGVLVGSAATASADGTATANKSATAALVFQTGKSSATVAAKDLVIITDTNGVISGLSGVAYDILVTESDSDDAATYNGTFSVTPVWNSGVTGQSFEVANLNGFGLTVSSATAAATTATVTSADVIRSVYAASHSFTVNVDNQFGANMSNVAVSGAIAGRNSTVNVASAISNASGNAVLTYTDASTSTTSLTDTLTFTAASGVTDTASVTYTSLAGLGVSTVLATTSQTSATTGADNTTITPFAIAAVQMVLKLAHRQ